MQKFKNCDEFRKIQDCKISYKMQKQLKTKNLKTKKLKRNVKFLKVTKTTDSKYLEIRRICRNLQNTFHESQKLH